MGELSKKSGEIGEKLADKLLKMIGWKNSLHNITIKCSTPSHINESGNQRSTHGEDIIFLYNNPFYDDCTEVVHISVKNNIKKYPVDSKLKSRFKEYFKELQATIECAKHSPELNEIITTFGAKKNKNHSGLLIWLQNDLPSIERDIKPLLSNIQLDQEAKYPTYLIDNSRASFLLKAIDDMERVSLTQENQFFFPPIGTNIRVNENRTDSYLPLELIASDIVPCLIEHDEKHHELIFYADQKFSLDAYKKLISYSLQFSNGLVKNIRIGMPDYNPTSHERDTTLARLSYKNRKEIISPFSFNRSILSFAEEGK